MDSRSPKTPVFPPSPIDSTPYRPVLIDLSLNKNNEQRLTTIPMAAPPSDFPCSLCSDCTDLERCSPLSAFLFEGDQALSAIREEVQGNAAERTNLCQLPVHLKTEKLHNLSELYINRQQFRLYEATMLEIVHLYVSEQSDLVLLALASLARFYRKHTSQYRSQVLQEVDALLSVTSLPDCFRWKLREAKVNLHKLWGDEQLAIATHLSLIRETKDTIRWKNLNYKLATELRKRERFVEVEEVYWEVFAELRTAQVKVEVVHKAARNFIDCYQNLWLCNQRSKVYIDRLLETSTYLQSQVPPLYSSLLSEYLSPSNPLISNSDKFNVECVLSTIVSLLLSDFREENFWDSVKLAQRFAARRGTTKETFIKLLLRGISKSTSAMESIVSYKLMEICTTLKLMNNFQGAEEFLRHSVCSQKPYLPATFAKRVRSLYSS